MGASLPPGLRVGDLLVLGIAAAIGFTVSLFFATAAFPAGAALAETKMGALLSFGAAPRPSRCPRHAGTTGGIGFGAVSGGCRYEAGVKYGVSAARPSRKS